MTGKSGKGTAGARTIGGPGNTAGNEGATVGSEAVEARLSASG